MPEALKPFTAPGLNVPGAGTAVFGGDGVLYRAAAGVLSAVGSIRAERSTLAAQYLQLDGGDGNGTRITAEYTTQKYLRINNNGAAGVVTTASIQFALGDVVGLTLVAGDKLLFGSAQDTDLYRAGAGMLKTGGQMLVGGALTVDGNTLMKNTLTVGRTTIQGGIAAHLVAPTADTYPLVVQGVAGQATDLVRVWNSAGLQVLVTSAGVLQLNNGMSFGTDTNLYRSAADVLATDDALTVGGLLTVSSATPKLSFYVAGVTERGFIHYSTATPALRIDSDENIQLAPANTVAITIDNAGKVIFGAALDTVLYRSAAGKLQTDGAMTAVGGFITPTATKTADYALTASDNVILANAAMTATLPSAVTAGNGRQYTVKNRHASAAVTLASAAGTIDGVATLAIASMESITVVSDGANWWVI